MSAGKHAFYVVHFEGGERSERLGMKAVRELIQSGRLGVADRVSREGGPPLEYYQYDEFVDLWDVDETFAQLYGDGEPEPVESQQAEEDTHRTVFPSPPDVPPSPFLPQSAPAVEGAPSDEDDLDGLFLEPEPEAPIESTRKVPHPAAGYGQSVEEWDEAGQTAPDWQFDDLPWLEEEEGEPGFDGYDPLADRFLDPVTIRDLLYGSTFYTVLTARQDADAQELQRCYLARREMLAHRQRDVGRTDAEQTAALDDVRRLLVSAYEHLRDDVKRASYHDANLPASAAYLGIEVKTAAQALIEESLSELEADDESAVDVEEEAPLFEDGFFGDELYDELGEGVGGEAPPGLVDFSGPYPEVPDEAEAGGPSGPRVYADISQTVGRRTLQDLSPVGEIFHKKAPSERLLRPAARRKSTSARAAVGARRRTEQFSVEVRHPSGLQWAVEGDPSRGLLHAVAMGLPALLISLAVVLGTGLGEGETDYSTPSTWFFGRGGVLIALAAVGTMALRKERLTRVGLFPAPIHILIGIGVGAFVGLLGSRIAPIYLDEGSNVGLVLISMFFIAVAHELFFRGFVTRVLLVGFESALSAIFISCLIYGIFHLSYYRVLEQSGFYLFYYSLLLYGFGLGSVYALLYWRSRSIWPSVVAHTCVLSFAMLMAP